MKFQTDFPRFSVDSSKVSDIKITNLQLLFCDVLTLKCKN